MIYDDIERELETMCEEMKIDMTDMNNLRDVRMCVICGTPFLPYIECEKKNGQKYMKYAPTRITCSPQCSEKNSKSTSAEYHKEKFRSYNRPLPGTKMVMCTCPRCGAKHEMPEPTDWRRYCPKCWDWIDNEYVVVHMGETGHFDAVAL